jgi:hypothetical protein
LTRIAAKSVAVQLHLPTGVELVAVSGGPPQQGALAEADGQNLGVGTTMVFHLFLHVPAGVAPCQTLGFSASWISPGGEAATVPDAEPARMVPLEELMDTQRQPSPGFELASAVVLAAGALRGDSTARIGLAIERLTEGFAAGDPVRSLCLPLSERCADMNGSCAACSP